MKKLIFKISKKHTNSVVLPSIDKDGITTRVIINKGANIINLNSVSYSISGSNILPSLSIVHPSRRYYYEDSVTTSGSGKQSEWEDSPSPL